MRVSFWFGDATLRPVSLERACGHESGSESTGVLHQVLIHRHDCWASSIPPGDERVAAEQSSSAGKTMARPRWVCLVDVGGARGSRHHRQNSRVALPSTPPINRLNKAKTDYWHHEHAARSHEQRTRAGPQGGGRYSRSHGRRPRIHCVPTRALAKGLVKQPARGRTRSP